MQPFLAMIIPTNTEPPVTPPPGSGNWPSTGLPPHPSFPIFFPPGTHPGQPGWPSWGTPPTQPPQPPLGFWGPNDPRPSQPIAEPPWGWGRPEPTPPTPGGPNYPSTGLPPHPAFPIFFPPGTHPGQPGWPSWGPRPPIEPPVEPPTLPGTKPPGTATPPGEVPPHPAQGVTNLYVWVPYVGVVGPIYIPPGMSLPTTPPTQPPVEPPVEPPVTPPVEPVPAPPA
jgi:hypothetical protein